VPVGVNQIWMKQKIREAIAEATRRGKLRPNSVDSITGENSGDNLGPGTPIVHFEQWEEPEIEMRLILKGGGCENTNAQYSLPATLDHLGRADRTLEGVRQGLRSRRGRRLHRRRSHVRLPARERTAVQDSRRRE
jgi:fumarate hydratase class I